MKVLLTTLHAKYIHSSLALPCLAASCSSIPGCSIVIKEFTIHEPSDHILRAIVAENADIVGFSTYIWNIEQTVRVVDDLKKIAPETVVVLGGPETAEAELLL